MQPTIPNLHRPAPVARRVFDAIVVAVLAALIAGAGYTAHVEHRQRHCWSYLNREPKIWLGGPGCGGSGD